MTTTIDLSPDGRIRTAWAAAHRAVPGVATWERRAAHAVPWLVLPSSAWRIAACTFHAPIMRGGVDTAGTGSGITGVSLEVYVVLLSLVSELVAFTAVGLVASWGEVVPRWLPLVGGRRVPTMAAVVPAALGAAVLTLLWTWTATAMSLGLRVDGSEAADTSPIGLDGWRGVLAVAAYAPLLLWGPLLAAVTVGYWRRRRSS